jgi:hypothetical protein
LLRGVGDSDTTRQATGISFAKAAGKYTDRH